MSSIPRIPPGCPPQAWLTVINVLRFYDKQGISWHDKETGRTLGLILQDIVYTRRGDKVAQVKLQFDAGRLPPGITKKDVLKPEILETLPYVVHGDVLADDRHGLALVVDFERKSSTAVANLPAIAKFRVGYADPIINKPGTWIPLGMSASGPEWYRLEDLDHILITGITHAGKSTWIQAMIGWLTLRYTPQQVKLVLLDAKNKTYAEELGIWEGAAHLWCPVTYEPHKILQVFHDLRAYIEARGASFGDYRNYDKYVAATGDRLPRIVVIFDEFMALKDTMSAVDFAEIKTQLGWYARTVRSKGVHMICGTQDVKAEALDTSITAQFDYRVSFRLPDLQTSARLKVRGAETISQSTRGRLITNIGGPLHMLQGFLMDDKYLEARVASARAKADPARPHRQLTDEELRMCQVAYHQLDGRFNVNQIYAITGPKSAPKGDGIGLSKRLIEDTARSWHERGLLAIADGDSTSGYIMTQELGEKMAQDEQIIAEESATTR
jgi:hypothetical protein